MVKSYNLYLDVCCFNRPFDDWSQERVRLEGEVILSILARVEAKQWQITSSEAVEVELMRMTNLEKLQNVRRLLSLANQVIFLDSSIDQRSQNLESLGFGLYDSFHIACAEIAKVDVLLTTDDRLLRKAKSYSSRLKVAVENPVNWLMSIFQNEGESNHDTP